MAAEAVPPDKSFGGAFSAGPTAVPKSAEAPPSSEGGGGEETEELAAWAAEAAAASPGGEEAAFGTTFRAVPATWCTHEKRVGGQGHKINGSRATEGGWKKSNKDWGRGARVAEAKERKGVGRQTSASSLSTPPPSFFPFSPVSSFSPPSSFFFS